MSAFRCSALTAVAIALSTPAFAADDGGKGKVAFNNTCRTCHSLKEGDNRIGPSLHGVFGRKAGSVPDYHYSQGLKNSGIVWDAATLEKFIANPEAVVPNNNMKPYPGLSDSAVRQQIVEFLKSESEGP